MNNVLIINGHQYYKGIAEGNLTKDVIKEIDKFCTAKGCLVKHSSVESYEINDELEKFKWADLIVFQYPVYWMGLPWIAKKYVDDIFSSGVGEVTYRNDRRSLTDISKKYGSGGLMGGKKYMLSLTYNCPLSEFSSKDGFFDGLSLEESNCAVHKVFQFCGATKTETFSIHDVYKGDLKIDDEFARLNNILKRNIS